MAEMGTHESRGRAVVAKANLLLASSYIVATY